MCTSVNVPLELLRLPWRPEAHPVCNTTSYLSVAARDLLRWYLTKLRTKCCCRGLLHVTARRAPTASM